MTEHGGNSDEAAQRYGLSRDQMCDLSTAISPIAYQMALPDSNAYQALPMAEDMAQLYAAARQYYKVPETAAICGGAGSQSLLSALPHLMAPRQVWCPEPTYNEHRYRWEKAGHKVSGAAKCPKEARVIILVQPNNPTGRVWQHYEIAAYLSQMRACEGLLIIDEAFADVMPEISACAHTGEAPLVILRSLGKFFGLAGLRVGFAIGAEGLIDRLADEIGPWPVSQPAMVVAKSALTDTRWQKAHLERLRAKAADMVAILAEAGFTITGHTPLFVTLSDHRIPAFHDYLARHGFWTRIYRSDPTMMRVGLLPDGPKQTEFETVLSGWQK